MAKGAGKGTFWQKEQHFQRYEAASHTLGKMERVWQMQLHMSGSDLAGPRKFGL